MQGVYRFCSCWSGDCWYVRRVGKVLCDEQANHTAAWWFFLFSRSLPQNIVGQSYDAAASYSGSGLCSCNPPDVSKQNPNNAMMGWKLLLLLSSSTQFELIQLSFREASAMLHLGERRTRLLMDRHRFTPSALPLRYTAVWGLCALTWPWAEEFPCGGGRGWAGCQGSSRGFGGCGTVWSCVLPDTGGTGNRNAFSSVIQAIAEPLNICLVGHTPKNLYFDTAIPSFAVNVCFVQNFRLSKSPMMKN